VGYLARKWLYAAGDGDNPRRLSYAAGPLIMFLIG
jgi:hypothetical protein